MDNFLTSTLKQHAPLITSGTIGAINWHWLDHGVMVIEPRKDEVNHLEHVLLSAGVHGNETAPIELLDQLVDDLLNSRIKLNVKLMLMLGNPAAMRNGERYNDIDLNRLFSQHHQNYPICAETLRAQQLEALTAQFLNLPPVASSTLTCILLFVSLIMCVSHYYRIKRMRNIADKCAIGYRVQRLKPSY